MTVLLFGAASLVHADVLPPECSNIDLNRSACQKAKEYNQACGGHGPYFSQKDVEEAEKRRNDNPLCNKNNTTSKEISKYCQKLTYSCDGISSIFSNRWFYIEFVLTIIVELAIISLFLHIIPIKNIISIIALNIATYTPLTIILVSISQKISNESSYILVALFLETLVVVAEAFAFTKILNKNLKSALLISASANAASVAFGLAVNSFIK